MFKETNFKTKQLKDKTRLNNITQMVLSNEKKREYMKEYNKKYKLTNERKMLKKDYMKEYNKNYYQNHKKELIDYDRNKRQEKMICICNSNISKTRRNFKNHLNTQKHKKFMLKFKSNLN